jgi:hypothetical protein
MPTMWLVAPISQRAPDPTLEWVLFLYGPGRFPQSLLWKSGRCIAKSRDSPEGAEPGGAVCVSMSRRRVDLAFDEATVSVQRNDDSQRSDTCTGRKGQYVMAYATEEEAEDGALYTLQRYGTSLAPYECDECGEWHLGPIWAREREGYDDDSDDDDDDDSYDSDSW